ncbi:MAG: RHS repeat-associated core domain-containing protein, partial [Candidatus Acidiferrales bacterium]
ATFTIPYTYDLLGDVTSYGSGTGAEIFTQSINAAGLPTQVTASWSDANHPATLVSNVHYNAAGNVISGTFGNSLTETFAYNGRLQPCRSNLNSSGTVLSTCGDSVPSGNYLDISAGYGSQDNGNVTSWSATGAQIFNRSYTYDAVNRLSTMSAPGDQCTGLTWTYDAWGNRTDQTATGGTCDTFHQSVNGSNQFASGYSYDADGNMIYDGVHNYFYDAEDRLIQVDGTKGNCSTATACYLYDAQGRRTQKIYGSNNMGYTYDLSGRVSSEWCQPCGTYNGWAGGYVFLAGRMFAQYTDGTVLFTQTDHLRSTRLLTGYPTPGVSACYDYYPFGEIISCGATGDQPQKFTGYLRDGETNLDDANARYFASSLGRFMSPDPSGLYFADPTDPQQLNLYSYVRNSSLEFLDPFGLTTCDANGNNCQDTVTVNGGDGCDLLCQLWLNLYGQLVSSAGSLSPPGPYAFLGGGGGGGGAGPQSPCTNATLAAAGVNAQEQIGMAQGLIAAGKAGAGASQFSNPVFGFFGGMFGYYEAVKTGGPNDIKDQPGPGYHNQTGVDAGNISFGVTCPYGAGFCQFAAGLAQTLSGNPNFNGTLTTGFDTPSDNAGIRTGQAMRAAGCHE